MKLKILQDFYQVNSVNNKIIYSLVSLVRTANSHYIKEIYQNPMLEKNKNGIIAIDESLFCHTCNNEQIWLVGLIDTYTKYFRI